AMPKTLDIQGFSGLREEVVRSEGRTSRSPVQQALILPVFQSNLLAKPQKSSDFWGFCIGCTKVNPRLSRG
ncbi:MAG: hypothetical protein J6C98_07155, partial [Oscillospiraceae bacterium]|nr:hypothetical protein [Oscillospiraceae bacterium]